MSRVILLCGKLCSGKTTLAARLKKEENAVILSMDALMLHLFPEPLGSEYGRYAERGKRYLLSLAAELALGGTNVILDWGFWYRRERTETRAFFKEKGIECPLYWLDPPEEEWRLHITERNHRLEDRSEDDAGAYFIDEGLLKKCLSNFEPPLPGEADRVLTRATEDI